ncbi:SOS response-associated peptidase [Phytoactinopolyspora halotolerans]|uniref:Abasic site processing protein n=1 Tax=Phytoactinopolyspora halotolerans TaxID=1981512 RepID=A0A6L9SEU6_9ACTN|nr:SOS response-associated peptidase [Phytoactinopolyspora halotolerans]NEE02570.1 SOS response-associated peptidase [Phytoactinopolyspora halotolerans]
MCGRYVVSQDPDDLAEEFGVDRVDVRERLEPDWNVAPSKDVYAVLTRRDRDTGDQERRLATVRWGLIPSWAKDPSIGNRLINARVETAAEKPSFRRAFAARRCLLPADGFYEWRGEKKGKRQPFYIHPRDGMLAMAGLYEIWRDPTRSDDDPHRFRWSMVILTTDAVDEIGEIHDRMPMLVGREHWAEWLDPANGDVRGLTSLLAPAVPGVLDAYPVSTEVNKADNNGPQLIEPATL